MITDTKTVISINNISKTYEGPPPVKALDEVSLEVNQGDLVAIVGQSGSGKSTLLNMIGLLDSVTAGSIQIEGKDISELSDNELSKFRGEKIGFIFQSFFLLPGLNAQENVAEGLYIRAFLEVTGFLKQERSLKKLVWGIALLIYLKNFQVDNNKELQLQELWYRTQHSFWQTSQRET